MRVLRRRTRRRCRRDPRSRRAPRRALHRCRRGRRCRGCAGRARNTCSTADSIATASASRPSEWRSSSAAERIAPTGLATPCAGDVRRRAVDRFVQAAATVAQRGRRQQAERAGQRGGLVGEDVAEQVLGDHHVVAVRLGQQQHRHRVDQLVLDRHVGIVGGDALHRAAPQPRGFQHVGLVDRGDMAGGGRAPDRTRGAPRARSRPRCTCTRRWRRRRCVSSRRSRRRR